MNRKEYELIAGVLCHYLINDERGAFHSFTHDLADILKENYKTFDRSKFLKSCGLEEV